MLKKIITYLLVFLFISCDGKKDKITIQACREKRVGAELLGFWNNKKVSRNSKDVYTLLYNDKNHLVISDYIHFDEYLNNQYTISIMSDTIIITDIMGQYPVYTLYVKREWTDLINDKYVTKWHYGQMIVHFKDENSFWFEYQMSKEFKKSLMSFGFRFSNDEVFYRAEIVNESIKRDMSPFF